MTAKTAPAVEAADTVTDSPDSPDSSDSSSALSSAPGFGVMPRTTINGNVQLTYMRQNESLLPAMASAGGDVIGVDWRIPIEDARARLRRFTVERPAELKEEVRTLAAQLLEDAG